MRKLFLVGFLALMTGGCVSTQYEIIEAPVSEISSLQIDAIDSKWNKAPGTVTGYLPKGAQLWTRDGILLDQLQLLGPIAHEQAIYVSNSESLVFPTYRQEMLPNEVRDLVVASLTKRYGASSIVEGSSLRPTRLAGQRAFAFDLKIVSAESPELKGTVSAVKFQEKLYLLAFIAAKLHYFDKHFDVADSVIQSSRFVEEP